MTIGRQFSVADDLFLCALDDRTGKLAIVHGKLALGLAAGLIAELLLAGTAEIHRHRLVLTGGVPPDSLTHAIVDLIQTEPTHAVKKWLDYVAQEMFPIEKVALRLIRAGVITQIEDRHLIRAATIRYPPLGDNTAAYRPVRLARALGELGTYDINVTKPGADAALAMIAHAIELTDRLLRDAPAQSWKYLEHIHQQVNRTRPDLSDLATSLGELVAEKTFTLRT